MSPTTAPPSSDALVCHPMKWESYVDGGVTVSARQQRAALDRVGVPYTPDPDADYDVLHLNFPGPRALAALFDAKRRGKPVVVHAHSVGENIAGTYRLSRLLSPAIRRYFVRVFEHADAVVAVSPYMRDRLRANGVETDVAVVSNGVDGEALDGYDELDVPDDDGLTVVNLAQVYDVKGVDDFVEVADALPDAAFVWYGPKHRYLSPRRTKRTVERAPENATFPGFVPDKREAFARGDVFFFPTYRDNQPLAVLEAAYCRLPIVTRDIPAFEGWLEHDVHCLKGDSPAEFRDHLVHLRDDRSLRRRLGHNAARMAREHSLDHVGERLAAVYGAVTDGESVTPERETLATARAGGRSETR